MCGVTFAGGGLGCRGNDLGLLVVVVHSVVVAVVPPVVTSSYGWWPMAGPWLFSSFGLVLPAACGSLLGLTGSACGLASCRRRRLAPGRLARPSSPGSCPWLPPVSLVGLEWVEGLGKMGNERQ